MADFRRNDRLDLRYSVRLTSAEVGGRVGDVRQWTAAGAPQRDGGPATLPQALAEGGVPGGAAELLGAAAAEAGMRPVLSVPLDALTVPPGTAGRARAGGAGPVVELQVPAPGPDEGQVVLEVDGTGVVRWSVSATAERRAGGDRAGGVQSFRIPVEQFAVPAPDGGRERGLVAFGARKVLHVLRFPIERAAGAAATFGVGQWESRNRPYGLRLTTPGDFLDAPADGPVAPERLAALADRPFLLFVHGTFSSCRSGFGGVAGDPELLRTLHERYQGRVLVFDHPTVHVDPAANAAWLLERLPTDRPLTFDLVAHSRGGLVARGLGVEQAARTAGRPAPSVRNLVHVAVPNAGTVLASRQRLGDLLDVVTNLATLLPDGPVGTSVAVVLEVVKHCAVGVLGGLDGLAAMDPAAESLAALNAAPVPAGSTVRAVASDFEPAARAGVALRALDVLVDGLFATGNDLVVPTAGVYDAASYQVADPLLIPSSSAVAHSGYFADPQVRSWLSAWLPGS